MLCTSFYNDFPALEWYSLLRFFSIWNNIQIKYEYRSTIPVAITVAWKVKQGTVECD